MTVYRKSDIEFMARAVASYIDGTPEAQVCEEFFVPNCNTLFTWAYDSAIRRAVRAEKGWTGDQYSNALHARRTETKANALIEYLMRADISQTDIKIKYSSSTCGAIGNWYNDTSVRIVVLEKTGLTEEQLETMWSKRTATKTPVTITNYARRFSARKRT